MSRCLVRALLLCCMALVSHPLAAGEKALPADLAFVPPDAVGFVHVRLGDMWKSDFFKEYRDTLLKAGDKALAAFDERFFPRPSSLDRLTVFIPAANDMDNRRPEHPVFVLSVTRPIDKDNLLKYSVADAKLEKLPGGKVLLVDAKSHAEIYFINDRTLAFGPVGAVRSVLTSPRAAKGFLTAALKQAQSGKSVVAAVNAQSIPPMALRQVPPPFQPLLKAKLAVFSLDVRQEGQIDLRLVYDTADEAQDAQAAAQAGIQMARKFLVKGRADMEKKVFGDGKPGSLEELPEAASSLLGLGMLNRLEDFLATEPLRKEGNDLHLTVKIPQVVAQSSVTTSAILVALLVPAVQKVREAAARTQSINNLKQIGLAMHNYHDTYRKLPSAAICDAAGKPLLSWRVAILPFIEQNPLYRQFKLDEPWDSEHNKKLIPRMPATYALPIKSDRLGETHYRVFVEGGAGFEWSKGLGLLEITDGTSNTILAVETADSVPWTQPEELVYDAKKPLPKMGNFHGGGTFNAVFFDASVRALKNNMAEKNFRAFITRGGGERVEFDD